jgi:hypothetical protein
MSKYFLGFHTIFLLNEHIDWLDDFIKYYINLGFEHFYLYDNDGSNGNDGSRTHNKYGFPVSTVNTEESDAKFDAIKAKYPGKITHIKWQPRDGTGNIFYGYNESISHLLQNYGNEVEWIAFMDLDEMLISSSDINIVEYLRTLESGINSLKILQKKFVSLQTSTTNPAFMDPRCVDYPVGEEWAPKWIGRPREFSSIGNMHWIYFKGNHRVMDQAVLRFNHYNTNQWQLDWMKDFYKSAEPFTLNGIDTVLAERYKHIFSDEKKE